MEGQGGIYMDIKVTTAAKESILKQTEGKKFIRIYVGSVG